MEHQFVNQIMTNNFKLHKAQTTPLNEKCSNFSLDLNLIQLPRLKKKPTRKAMCTWVDWLMWDFPTLPFNVRTLMIYLKVCPFLMTSQDKC